LKKVSVIGTKDFSDYQLLCNELNKEKPDVLVVGGKDGADSMAQRYSLEKEIQVQVILPDYKKHGRSANYLRNLEMIDNSTLILIFWNERSKSPFNYLPYIKKYHKLFRTIIY